MSGSGPPRWVLRVLMWLLPPDYGRDVAADLDAAARRRFGPQPGGVRVQLWYVRQVCAPSMARLGWRLRRRAPVGYESDRRRLGGWGGGWTEARQALRSLRRSPAFAVAVVASLAVGIGANVAVYSVVNAVLLRGPGYADGDRLTFVWNQLEGFESTRLPMSAFQVTELRAEEDAFEDVAAVWATSRTLTWGDRSVLASAGLVTPNFFSMLGVTPVAGRTFVEQEGVETGSTVVVSHELWQRELGGDPDVVGTSLMVEGEAATVVGVLPADFRLHFPSGVGVPDRLEVFEPFPWVAMGNPEGPRFLRAVAKLETGLSLAAADAAAKEVARRLRETYVHMGRSGDEFRVVTLGADTTAGIRPVLLALLAGVALFLLLTAANVASLVLARTMQRDREFAIRRGLGASRARLARQLLLEVGTLTAVGAALGLLLGVWGVEGLWALRPADMIRVHDVGLDGSVWVYTGLAALLAGILASVLPLMVQGNGSLASLRYGTGVGHSRGGLLGRRVMVTLEIAICVVLVVGAGLMARTVSQLRSAELGFTADHVLTFRMGLPRALFSTDGERGELARLVEEELGALPGVVAVGGSSHLPLGGWANWSGVAAPSEVAESDRDGYHFDHRAVTPGYADALGLTVLEGRFIGPDDRADGQPVVVIDEALASRVFPQGDAVGRTLSATRYLGAQFVPEEALVVGVIADVRDRSPGEPSSGQVLWPFVQSARWELSYALRTEDDPALLADRVRALIHDMGRDLAVADFMVMDDYVGSSMAESRFVALVSSTFSLAALLLAALGLYGAVAYATARRTRELGLRLVMGARSGDLFARVIGEGVLVASAGVVLGLLAAVALTRYLTALLYGVDPLETSVFGAVSAFLFLVAIVASAGPAVRASRLDPLESLRAE